MNTRHYVSSMKSTQVVVVRYSLPVQKLS
jgi:hypothetical protein